MATEIGRFGITSNLLLPGSILTGRLDDLDGAAAKRTGKSLDEIRTARKQRFPSVATERWKSSQQRPPFLQPAGELPYRQPCALRWRRGLIRLIAKGKLRQCVRSNLRDAYERSYQHILFITEI